MQVGVGFYLMSAIKQKNVITSMRRHRSESQDSGILRALKEVAPSTVDTLAYHVRR